MSLIEKIHNDPELYGIVVEVGAGNPVATELYSVGGASKTIMYSEVPNSKEYNYSRNNIHPDSRSVDLHTAINMYVSAFNNEHAPLRPKFVFTNTCQIGPNCVTHGWIVYGFDYRIGAFHYTFEHTNQTRSEYIKEIGQLGVQIIAAKNQEPVINGLIDQIYRIDFNGSDISATPDIWAGLENLALADNVDDQMIVLEINDQDEITYGRLEDYYRKSNDLVVYKGSFNPLQTAHVELSNIMDNEFPNSPNFYSISVNTHEKGSTEIHDLYYRICSILLDTRKPVILNKRPLFSDFTKFLRNRGYDNNKRIHYACGSDTIFRVLKLGYGIHETNFNTINYEWIKFLYDNLGVKYHYRNRIGYKLPEIKACDNFRDLGVDADPISSTTIREWVNLGNWAEVKNNVLSSTYRILKDEEYRKSL